MAEITLQGHELDVDIREELSQFTWERPTWKADKLIAASPFRYDNTPSFFVNLDGEYAGTWSDSGAYDADYESGNLPKLLAFLRDETYEETCEYLIELYGVRPTIEGEHIEINEVKIAGDKPRTVLDEVYSKQATIYLLRRGISERVQRFMGVGYDRKRKAITMPWRYPDGVLANVKYRKVDEKTFWYVRGAAPVRTLVYGIDKVYKHELKRVVVCEAEIDAMSWYTSGIPAIAIGGTAVSDKQVDIIRKSPIEELIIAQDNDKAGGKLSEVLRKELRGYMSLYYVDIPLGCKDANEALVGGVNLSSLEVNGYRQISTTAL